MTRCPTGCGRNARPGHLMCHVCWFTVPAALRAAVWRTWRRYERTGSDDDFEHYEQAREAAIASVP